MNLKKLSLLFFFAALVSACSSTTGNSDDVDSAVAKSTAESADAASTTLAAKDEEICKVEAITGSRFKRKVCATEAEWERMSEESSRMINDSNVRSMQGNPDGG